MKRNVKDALSKKSIRNQIKLIIVVMLATSLTLIGVISSILNFRTLNNTLENSMSEMAHVAAQQVQYKLGDIVNPVEVVGSIARLTSETTSTGQKQEILDRYVKHYGWELMYIADKEGNVAGQALNVSSKDYFKDALAGTTAITEPFQSAEAGKMVVVVSAPLWKDGLIDTEVAGVVFAAIDAREFTELVSEIKVSENGAAYIIDAEGDTIAHANFSLIESGSNTIEESKTDSGLKQLAKLEQNMIDGKDGFGKYRYGGTTKYMAYAPVGINGWSIAITAPAGDFNGSAILGVVITAIMLVVTLSSAGAVANQYGNKIGGAISACAGRLKLLAEGDLTTEVPVIEGEDETRILADSTAEIVQTQQRIIGDAKHLLSSMAEGNFAVKSKIGADAYVGAYMELLGAMRDLRDDMTRTLRNIVEASAQVEAGSSQLASASQDLAEGATEQTMAVEELLNTVSVVTEQVKINHQAADEAHEKIKALGEEADLSGKMMDELTLEMKNIEETSAKINEIIAEIEDIASQTNLLSLNASIEAARAGDAGRGFAVVADQIGKLAEQSAKSAVNTRSLIESSLQEIAKGSKVTDETAVHMESMMAGLNAMVGVIEKVREASDSQTTAIGQIKSEVDQISNVVQNNSAAAEESSATSEELSAQAQSMESMVAKFKLPEE